MDNWLDAKQLPADLVQLVAAPTQIVEARKSISEHANAVDSGTFSVGLIDSNRFSRECLTKAFEGADANHLLYSFDSAQDLAISERNDLGLILYHSHVTDATEPGDIKTIAEICDLYRTVPLVVLSDAHDAQQPKIIRKFLEAGALGVIPTKSTGITMSLAIIRFVQAGGTFVPPDLLLSTRLECSIKTPDKTNANRLTERQMIVLAQLDLGKANKLIAYELGMSESTVKVHVRNIMRKMNATNRTQAVYKARKFSENDQIALASKL